MKTRGIIEPKSAIAPYVKLDEYDKIHTIIDKESLVKSWVNRAYIVYMSNGNWIICESGLKKQQIFSCRISTEDAMWLIARMEMIKKSFEVPRGMQKVVAVVGFYPKQEIPEMEGVK